MAKPRMDLTTSVGKFLEEQDGGRAPGRDLGALAGAMETEVAGLMVPSATSARRTAMAVARGRRIHGSATIELAIPKVRPGTYFPSLLEPPSARGARAIGRMQEAYLHGVSTGKVDDLVKASGRDVQVGAVAHCG